MDSGLPAIFLEKMEKLLGGEFDDFMASYRQSRAYGLRVNPLKLTVGEWLDISPMRDRVRPIPWTKDGFYYEEEDRPGRHPHYNAGLYYIQEPSAMSPAELLDVKPGHRVLDLCAAPGGKSTQLAGKLQGRGVLVTNDNAFERTKALAKNIELAGVRNAVIMNEEPAALAEAFGAWFDRILVDAPCSGEGMFRKDESMAAEWEKHSVDRCSAMQRDILSYAAEMVAPGGKLVYSTCTFNPEENEIQIAEFLAKRPDFAIEPIRHEWGWSAGRPDWIDGDTGLSEERKASLAGAARLWPHKLEGEGHFAVVLKREGEPRPFGDEGSGEAAGLSDSASTASGTLRAAAEPEAKAGIHAAASAGSKRQDARPGRPGKRGGASGASKAAAETDPVEAWLAFAAAQLRLSPPYPGKPIAFGTRVYLQPDDVPPLDGLRVVRAGWLVGDAKKGGRFEPSQPLAMGLSRGETLRSISWPADSDDVARYLRGETLFVDESELSVTEGADPKGYVLVCVDGYPLGWGKYAGGMLKNELSAGWRRLF
jgi:tRNA and rRNA cytosine-C5-methylases